jgi:hypothetical protein
MPEEKNVRSKNQFQSAPVESLTAAMKSRVFGCRNRQRSA